jgi:hypothetical protein
MPTIEDLRRIAEIEFADIITNTYQIDYKLRILFIDKSFLDAFVSERLPDRFDFHWECMGEQKTFYRYDNIPDRRWQSVATFPHHFHNRSQEAVEASPFPLTTIEGFRAFLEFIRNKLK